MSQNKEDGKLKRQKNLKKFGIDKPVLSHEAAVKNGSKGGYATAAKPNMQQALELIEKMPVTGKTKNMLDALGVPKDQQTGSVAMAATLYSMVMKGNPAIIDKYLDYILKHEENERKKEESRARIEAMVKGEVSVASSDDEEGLVQIYLPAIENEEDLTVGAKNVMGSD